MHTPRAAAADFGGCPRIFTAEPVPVSGRCSLGTDEHPLKPGQFEQLLHESMQGEKQLGDQEREIRRDMVTGRALCNRKLEKEIANLERYLGGVEADPHQANAAIARIGVLARDFEGGLGRPADWSDDDREDRAQLEERLQHLYDRQQELRVSELKASISELERETGEPTQEEADAAIAAMYSLM
ncbi:MAG: hypothetical protein ACLFVU_13335 [Phycisphaerae bacterium]